MTRQRLFADMHANTLQTLWYDDCMTKTEATALPAPLYKTTIVVYSAFDPASSGVSESDLVRDGESGDSIIASGDTEIVTTSVDVPQGVLEFHFRDPLDELDL